MIVRPARRQLVSRIGCAPAPLQSPELGLPGREPRRPRGRPGATGRGPNEGTRGSEAPLSERPSLLGLLVAQGRPGANGRWSCFPAVCGEVKQSPLRTALHGSVGEERVQWKDPPLVCVLSLGLNHLPLRPAFYLENKESAR